MTLRRDQASMPNQHKTVLTFTKGATAGALRLADVASRKRIQSITGVEVVPVDGFEMYPIEMLYGEELLVTASASQPVNVFVSEQKDFEEWRKEEAEEFAEDEGPMLSYPPFYFSIEEVRAPATLKFYATVSGTFLVGVFNITSNKARVKIEIVRWSTSEEECS